MSLLSPQNVYKGNRIRKCQLFATFVVFPSSFTFILIIFAIVVFMDTK